MNPRRSAAALLAIGVATCATPAVGQVGKLYPVDGAVEQPEFFTFRAHLLQIVQARDTAMLYALLVPNILNSFGGDGGVAEFKAMWRPGDPDSKVWEILSGIVSLGGTFHNDTIFSAPYTFSRFPAEFDAFDHVVIVGFNVRVRAEPRASAAVIDTVSFDIIPIAREAERGGWDDNWAAVRLADGRTGFVH